MRSRIRDGRRLQNRFGDGPGGDLLGVRAPTLIGLTHQDTHMRGAESAALMALAIAGKYQLNVLIAEYIRSCVARVDFLIEMNARTAIERFGLRV